jgi:hypothetical protein
VQFSVIELILGYIQIHHKTTGEFEENCILLDFLAKQMNQNLKANFLNGQNIFHLLCMNLDFYQKGHDEQELRKALSV